MVHSSVYHRTTGLVLLRPARVEPLLDFPEPAASLKVSRCGLARRFGETQGDHRPSPQKQTSRDATGFARILRAGFIVPAQDRPQPLRGHGAMIREDGGVRVLRNCSLDSCGVLFMIGAEEGQSASILLHSFKCPCQSDPCLAASDAGGVYT